MNRDLIFSVDCVESYGIGYDYTLPLNVKVSKKDFKLIKKTTKRCLKELKKSIENRSE